MSGIQMALAAGGGVSVVITLQSQYVVGFAFSGDTATATYSLFASGQGQTTASGSGVTALPQWCTPAAQAANYEVRATINTGSVSGPTGTTWYALSTNRTWSVSAASSGVTAFGEMLVEIRRVGTTTVVGIATVSLEASVE